MRAPLIALTALAMIAGTPVAAEDFVVRYSDLDLSTDKGQKSLEKRIDAAARSYCGVGSQQTGTRMKGNTSECMSQARAAAREQMAAVIAKQAKGG